MRRHVILGLVAASALAGPALVLAASPVPVTACGQVVQGTGQLVANLDCSGHLDDAVNLTGRLLLGGFTLTGNPAFDVVRCKVGSCVVTGPGTVTGGQDGVRSDHGARVEAGAIVTGNAGDGVRTDTAAKVYDATVSGNGGDGIRSKTRATVQRTIVSNNGSDGINTDGSSSLKGATVTGNTGRGIDSDGSARAKDSTVTGNGEDGLRALRVSLSDSTATGNGTNPSCGIGEDCADIASFKKPSVRGSSTCGTSRNPDPGGSWGVCSLD